MTSPTPGRGVNDYVTIVLRPLEQKRDDWEYKG